MQEHSKVVARRRAHSWIVGAGIVLNLLFALPLLIVPESVLGLLSIPVEGPIWIRFSGLLLLILSVFYVPVIVDLDRYRIYAWLAIVPSRFSGATFFGLAVFACGAPKGFIVGLLLDGTIGLLSLVVLSGLTVAEHRARRDTDRGTAQ